MTAAERPRPTAPLRVGLIGFGSAGRVFHAPFLAADDHYQLAAVVTSDRSRAAEVTRRHPDTSVVPDPEALWARADKLDLVVVASPPPTHAPLAHAALDHGVAVVIDKPLAVAAAAAEALVDRARRLQVPLTVFHNRRWDGDFRTVRRLIAEGRLGDVRRFESRFEWWKPEEPKRWKAQSSPAEGGGVLYDLGPHLLDQALLLFGPVTDVHAELARHRTDGGAEDDAFVSLLHESGVRSQLWMNAVAAQAGPRFHVLGSGSAYTSWGLDGQEAALKAGATPTDEGFGVTPESRWGVIGVDGSLEPVPTEHGAYAAFYAQLATALLDGGPLPVDPNDAVAALRIIERIHSGG